MGVLSGLSFTSGETAAKTSRSLLVAVVVTQFLILHASPADCFDAISASSESGEEDIRFFETAVRPLLHEACGKCHGEKTQWANLRTDSRSALLKGGDTGAAIIPGDPDNSLLIQSVRRTGDYEMPPDKSLTGDQIAILEKWVKMGAPWGLKDAAVKDSREIEWSTHWAFQPISKPILPAISATDWTRTPVDQFVLAKLAESELKPSPEADRRTLIRRVTYDLTGLPPSHEEVKAFLDDSSPDAYEKLVDRLLDSPQYGEHWARHWLDLARYADTKGYVYGREENRFVHSWIYRNWVARAFQEDLPYDKFLLLQMAADQVAPNDLNAQAAMGFLTLSRRFLGNSHDIIDDRIDVLGRTTMGLTIGCARCHDHKYDPIPTADYYSLYGVLQNSAEQYVRLTPVASPESDNEFEKGLQERLENLHNEIQKHYDIAAGRVRGKVTDYLIAQTELEKYPDVSFSQILSAGDIIPSYVHRWESYLRRSWKEQDPIFLPWHQFAAIPKDEFAQRSPEIVRMIQTGDFPAHPLVISLFDSAPASMREVAERYGQLFAGVENEWQTLIIASKEEKKDPPTSLSDEDTEALRQVLYGPLSPCALPQEDGIVGTEFFFDTGTTIALWELQKKVDQWLIDHPEAARFAVRMIDRNFIQEPRVFRRGNPATKGDEVPRRFPLVVAGEDRQPFTIGSGRLELAQGIVAPNNPLTPRVWVNRIWQHHFGTGIVPTPSDFGIRAPRPEHLELLDWLAQRLMESGWSTKAIHREILLSSAYRQSGSGPEDPQVRQRAQEIDPENHLIWKKDAHRLTIEEFRDSLLAVTGELNLQLGGRGVQLFNGGEEARRRTLYGNIDREKLPNVYRIFDFANPDLHIPVRSETTVSQQALFALNHPMLAERAQALRGLLSQDPEASEADRIRLLFEKVFQRLPSPEEFSATAAFLATTVQNSVPKPTPKQLAWQYGYGRVDLSSGKVMDFEHLPFFTGTAWQGGTKWPDEKLGWAQLTSTGGHPGNTNDRAVIRRWIAPSDLQISIESEIRHDVAKGNGIRGWIVSSQRGVLNQFQLHNNVLKTDLSSLTVRAGESIDFVVDVNGELGFDQFEWLLILRSQESQVAGDDSLRDWNSKRDFTGPLANALDPWSQLAQVLLLSNEFLFVH
ncbi:MAG TPA: PSD1 and planctomycete cytochrome C domain-containing protein [Planctomicrobium sp.]|nr:PSD1 and planctomycete cytochrome C domain-containing protein [Planctomicrobium sp.]